MTECEMAGWHHQLPWLTQTHVHRVSDAIQPSHPLSSLLLLPSIFPSTRVFSSESVICIRGPKNWSFSISICPSNEYSGLISFRMDWLDLLAVQGTLKSLLQQYSSKTSVFQRSPFFMIQLSCQYMRTRKTEHQRIDGFELYCWRRLLRVPWTARRSNQSILKEISPEYSLEGLMLKLKLQYFGHLM